MCVYIIIIISLFALGHERAQLMEPASEAAGRPASSAAAK